jgi:hypothetical protein
MFQWFRQMSVLARLRGLALLTVATLLALSSSLLWTSYQQRVADRQAAAAQGIELAHASVQWAYARQQFGKLDASQARQHTLGVLARLRQNKTMDGPGETVHSAMLTQTALTLGAVLVVSAMLWICIEVMARDLGRAASPGANAEAEPESTPLPDVSARRKARDPGRGPKAYRQGPFSSAATAQTTASAQSQADIDATSQGDPNEAAIQEVRRLRMAGAI